MPQWLTKLLIVLAFGPPMLAGVLLLVFGAWWLEHLDRKEDKHEQSECNGR